MASSARQERFYFLDCVRALAAWLVIWDHVVAIWPAAAGHDLPIVAWMRTYVTGPMAIIQDFGWLGVVLFFLISGFVITHVTEREQPLEFLIKRIFRIYPMVACAVALAAITGIGMTPDVGATDVVRNILLLNYFSVPQINLVGVAWTLAIEVLFYGLVFVALVVPDRSLRLLLVLGCVLAALTFCRSFGSSFFLVAANAAYVPFLVIGQVVYLGVYRRELSPGRTIAMLGLCFALIIYGLFTIHQSFLAPGNSYMVGVFQALVIFLLFLVLEPRLGPNPVVRLLADTSFGVYITHGTVGFLAFHLVLASAGAYAAIVAALVATVVSAVLLHHAVEKPMTTLGRRLSRLVTRRQGVPAHAPSSS